ncbi:hypothetical protein PVAP13_2KG052658 [Panicum virgatum]|uniref:Uncharacterized protein n=1 Tax=Panicum virgatum TaxID=38727 RepID=A0A8T0W1M0_PANVG|nr:hypothetical protein PVAP13_2KG052658 [Panicum virgatum]
MGGCFFFCCFWVAGSPECKHVRRQVRPPCHQDHADNQWWSPPTTPTYCSAASKGYSWSWLTRATFSLVLLASSSLLVPSSIRISGQPVAVGACTEWLPCWRCVRPLGDLKG